VRRDAPGGGRLGGARLGLRPRPRRSGRAVGSFIAFVGLSLAFQQPVLAANPTLHLPEFGTQSNPALASDAAAAQSTKHAVVGEQPDRRTRNSRTLLTAQKQFITSLYSEPINYRDPQGNWQPIDSRVLPSSTSGYAWQNAANAFRASFKARLQGDYLQFEAGGSAFKLKLVNAANVAGSAAGNHVSYGAAFSGVDLAYASSATGIEETFTLAAADVVSAYRFILSVPASSDLRVVRRADGSVSYTHLTLPTICSV